jgi:phospholipid/cholesterol/gamma-HCH transport system ATP-binding protein
MAAKPNLLLFDDPTTGLDPVIATTVDDEIIKLRDLGHATCIMVTHQIRDAYYVATHKAVRQGDDVRLVVAPEAAAETRFMVLHQGRIYFEGSAEALRSSRDTYLRDFLFMTLPPW